MFNFKHKKDIDMADNDYPEIHLGLWEKTGEGGNGVTYEHPDKPDVLLKLNNGRSNHFEAVKEEFDTSVAVSRLGLSTPAMHEIVRVGNAYATLSQKIKNKKSLFRICHDQPERLEEMAQLFSEQAKELFSTACDTSVFPNKKALVLGVVDKATFISRKNREILRGFIERVPENSHCIHGDFQPGNIILAEGKCYWIDLGRFAWGDPMFDIGHLYNACMVYAKMKQARDLFHMTEQQLHDFWNAFAKAYTGKQEHGDFDREAARFGAVDIISRLAYVPVSLPEKIYFRILIGKLIQFF